MSRPTYETINLAALQHNLKRVNAMAPHSAVIAMVKANAYGHGIVAVAKALKKADAFGVASLEEGVLLREAGVEQPIVLMEGLFSVDELAVAMRHNFTLVVHHLPGLEILEQASPTKPMSVWLKINTGMHRLGFDPAEVTAVYQRLLAARMVKKPIGLMTHFAEADTIDSQSTQCQIDKFDQLTRFMDGPKSLANSAGIMAWPSAHRDWVRPGLLLYGASPFMNKTGLDFDLQPVMTLWSRLIAITHVKQGGKVGYGGTWVAPEDMSIGVVAMGYGDGYPQYARNGTPTLLNSIVCPLVGRVSMDMLTIDLRGQPDAHVGDKVILWGDGLPVEKMAIHNHTSAYEMLTRMTSRPKIELTEISSLNS